MRLWEIRLAARALKRRWPMTDAARRQVVTQLLGVIKDPSSQPCLVHAARALIDADRLNMEQEKRDQGIAERVDITSGGQPLTKIFERTSDFDPDSA